MLLSALALGCNFSRAEQLPGNYETVPVQERLKAPLYMFSYNQGWRHVVENGFAWAPNEALACQRIDQDEVDGLYDVLAGKAAQGDPTGRLSFDTQRMWTDGTREVHLFLVNEKQADGSMQPSAATLRYLDSDADRCTDLLVILYASQGPGFDIFQELGTPPTTIASSSAPQGVPSVFRGVTLGGPCAQLEGAVSVAPGDGGSQEWSRPGDSLQIGSTKLEKLTYTCTEGKVESVNGNFYEGGNAIRTTFESLWGPPTDSINKGDLVMLTWGSPFQGTTHATMAYSITPRARGVLMLGGFNIYYNPLYTKRLDAAFSE